MLPFLRLRERERDVQICSPQIPISCLEHFVLEDSGFVYLRQGLVKIFYKGLESKDF